MIQFTQQPIESEKVLAAVQDAKAGAVVLFLGTTRQFTDGKETVELHYDAYKEMAKQEMTKLEKQAHDRWPLVHCAIVHRLGVVPLAEASVAIAVSSAHRGDAFEAGKWLIDTLKEQVPIWKQEHWADGNQEWVHPTLIQQTQAQQTQAQQTQAQQTQAQQTQALSPNSEGEA